MQRPVSYSNKTCTHLSMLQGAFLRIRAGKCTTVQFRFWLGLETGSQWVRKEIQKAEFLT